MARQRRADGADLAAVGALGGKRRRLDLDRQAQLHHVEHVARSAAALGAAMRNGRGRRIGDIGARAAARHHQPVGAQRRDRLAHHGAADAQRRGQRLLGRQARARLQAAAPDVVGEPRHHLLGEIAGRVERLRTDSLSDTDVG